MMKIFTVLVLSLLIGSAGVTAYAAKPEPSAQDPSRSKPRKSKRLAPPCADEPADKRKTEKKKAG
ncbi:MAG: hypothetical protein A2140_06095 [Candidatus Muproteobacteria bacterium RBG_16_62_13]|uniref:Uncharacterized protein n=1 Tax=Candidatus Muproteobacteria bacterium RBG_16_62_13 TaxID=1817756 RepID=A0A1F6T782_9PROT|nr:MAG: hypothetical protein A2140_06095 [Candidatus Muproteobacteria bacterium RBG_16_62_13]